MNDLTTQDVPGPAKTPEAAAATPELGIAKLQDMLFSLAMLGGKTWESALAHFDHVLTAAGIGLYYYEIDKGQIYWSQWLFDLLGLEPGHPMNHTTFIDRMVAAQHREAFVAAISQAIANPGGQGIEYDYEFEGVDGRISWLRTRVNYVATERGGVLLGTTRDVQQEYDLRQSQKQTDALTSELMAIRDQIETALQGSRMTVWVQDENLRYEWAFNRHKDYKGYELIGKTDYEINMVQEMADYIAIKHKAFKENKRQHMENWINPGEMGGARVYLRAEITPYTTASGERKIIGTNTDLTIEKRAQEAAEALSRELAGKVNDLEQSERRLTVAVEGSSFALAIVAPGGRLIWSLNLPEYAQALGDEDPRLVLGGGAQQTLVARALDRAFTTGTAQHLASWFDIEGKARSRYLSLDIHPLPVNPTGDETGTPLPEDAIDQEASAKPGPQVIVRLHDLTEWETAQEQLRTSSERLRKEQNETKAALASLVMAHRQRAREIERSRALQHALQPKATPMPSRLAFASHHESCPAVGGDYFDYKQTGERLLMAIGDATGTGPLATLVVTLAKTHVQLMAHTHDMPTIMSHISSGLADLDNREGGAGLYLSLGLFELMPRGVLYCATAMPSLLIYRHASASIESRSTRGMFLGTHLPHAPQCEQIDLEAGDIVVAMTDGLSESRHPELGLIDPYLLERAIIQAGPEGPAAVKEALLATQREWLGEHPLHDDTNLICFSLKDLA